MKSFHKTRQFGVVLIALTVGGWNLPAQAQPKEHAVLTGNLWERMSIENKAAFVWGMATVLEFERHFLAKEQVKHSQGLVAIMIEALSKSGISTMEVVAKVDAYYQANPDLKQQPVIHAMFHEIILPLLKTTDSGRPVETTQEDIKP